MRGGLSAVREAREALSFSLSSLSPFCSPSLFLSVIVVSAIVAAAAAAVAVAIAVAVAVATAADRNST